MNTLRTRTRNHITAETILNSPRGGKLVLGSRTPRQGLLIKEEIHNQMVRLRDAFLREDPRITGTIPRHLMATTAALHTEDWISVTLHSVVLWMDMEMRKLTTIIGQLALTIA